MINSNKITVSKFSAELPGELDRSKRTFVTIEADIFDESYPDNQDGSTDRVYKAKLVGSTIVKQEGLKDTYVCKSKRSPSTRLRARIWADIAEDEYYELMVDKLIHNWESVRDFVKTL